MTVEFTVTQKERLRELSVEDEIVESLFEDVKERNENYKNLELSGVKTFRSKIEKLLKEKHLTDVMIIENLLEEWLINEQGYTRVSTPTIISKEMLEKMSITSDHSLSDQVFWLNQNKCLRPMLAPNLYVMMRELHRITNEAVKIFEMGPCFRKESQGAHHMNEFTMLNFVDLAGVKDGQQMERLEYMAREAMKVLEIDNYELQTESSVVYESTLDILVEGIEVASGSFGPHTLDGNWGVNDTWVGIGFGIERLALVKSGLSTIKRVGKSITFIDGSPLNI